MASTSIHNGPIDEWLRAGWSESPECWRIDVEGASIACRSWNRFARKKPGVVLVHGFGAHARWWDHIAPSLMEGRHVVAFDLSGMGDSEWRSKYSRRTFAKELLAVADASGMDRPVVIAHSFGGSVSLMACALNPGFARRLVLIDCALPAASESDLGRVPEIPMRVYNDAATAISRYRLLPPGRWPEPAVLAYIAEHSVTRINEGWRWKFDAAAATSLNTESYREQVLGIRVPADFVLGSHSEIMTPERIAMMPNYMPLCEEPITIPACHHHVMVEQPIALVAALCALLANDRT